MDRTVTEHAEGLALQLIFTCKSPDPAPLEEPGARVSSVVLEVELLGDPVPVLPVEGVPSDTDADVSRHGAEHHLNLEEPRSLLI